LRQKIGLISATNNCFRLIHGEGDFLSGLIIDIYGDTAVIQAHSVGIHFLRHDFAKIITELLPNITTVFYKSDSTLPFKAHLSDKESYLINNNNSDNIAIENGLKFNIDFIGGQKTGFFIDQHDNRKLLEKYSRGKTVLNMFCYTGGFSVYALRGEAESVVSVDSSDRAIELTKQNINLNFPDNTNHTEHAVDATRFFHDNDEKFDIIILDPPAFAKHLDAVSNALKGYKTLNIRALEHINKGGLLFTFSCSQAISKEQFRLAVFSAAAIAKRNVRILHQLNQPADHPINIYHPEGEYLKGLVLYVE
jgi:23S rRNA (cytosine1962-C5)-methyltransferase